QLENKVSELRENQSHISSMNWSDQVELRDEVLEAGTVLSKLISSVGKKHSSPEKGKSRS
ncbi:MAG: hypothetical protein LC631_08505, partial [Desulfovibrionales bacterium]|nr:hypothetical protein [Desulfovibrionales bacterium]